MAGGLLSPEARPPVKERLPHVRFDAFSNRARKQDTGMAGGLLSPEARPPVKDAASHLLPNLIRIISIGGEPEVSRPPTPQR